MPAAAQLLASDSTAAVILGASDWTRADLPNTPSFRRSANGLLAWLIDSAGLNIDPDLVINYFDSRAPASDQLSQLSEDLEAKLRDEGRPIADLLVYYIGHGFPDDAASLSLLVRHSKRGTELSTGIRVSDLATILKVSAPKQRRLTVFDCCYSERAVASFIGMGVRGEAVARLVSREIGAALPTRGGLFLGASPHDREAIGKPDAAGTLFTAAFLQVVRYGIEGGAAKFSFRDLAKATYDVALAEHGSEAPRPVLHPVNQRLGDLSDLPAFRNPAWRPAALPPDLVQRTRSTDRHARGIAVDELLAIARAGGPEAELAVEVLRGLLEDDSTHVRMLARHALDEAVGPDRPVETNRAAEVQTDRAHAPRPEQNAGLGEEGADPAAGLDIGQEQDGALVSEEVDTLPWLARILNNSRVWLLGCAAGLTSLGVVVLFQHDTAYFEDEATQYKVRATSTNLSLPDLVTELTPTDTDSESASEPTSGPRPTPAVTTLPNLTSRPPPPVRVTSNCVAGLFVVFFEWDSSGITPEAASILDNGVTQWKNCGGAQVLVVGHHDRSSSNSYALSISQRRADAVAAYLSSRGIPAARIVTEAYGESQPRVETADGVREPQNQRVEIMSSLGSN